MSHNVQITGIKIIDLDALDKACAELRKEGVNVTLDRGTPGKREKTFRTYAYGNNSTKADHVIRLDQCKYDVGLIQQPDGHCEPIYDNSLGLSVECPIACQYRPENQFNFRPITDKAELELAAKGHGIGKLMQRYTAVLAEKTAKLRGFSTRRVIANDGTIELVMTA